MDDNKNLILMIKNSVKSTAPNATVIIYGSYARGDYKSDSDLDVLVLLDKKKITREDEKMIKYPLYDIEFETGKIISPLVLAKSDWELRHKITPFYDNVNREGIVL